MPAGWRSQVLIAHLTPCGPTWSWVNPPDHAERLNIWFIAGGRGRWQHAGRSYQLRAGDCFVQRLWEPCVGRQEGSRPLEVLWANFVLHDGDGRRVDLRRAAAQLPPVHRHFEALEPMRLLLERMIARWQRGDVDAAGAWLDCALDECRTRDRDGAGATDATMATLCAQIRERPGRAWSVADLAAASGLDPDAFSRRFRRETGVSPRDFIALARIEAAKALLHMSSMPIGAIADELGYHDIFHFSRRFKERTGLSPSAFRRRR